MPSKYSCFITSARGNLSFISFLFIFRIKSDSTSLNSSGHRNISFSIDFLKIIYYDPPANGGLPTFKKYRIPLSEYTSDIFYDALLWIHSGAI
jgi:hypothetical protein